MADEQDDRHAWLEPGAFEVAPGVHRIPLPLPMDGLRAVNVYAVETGGGLVMIDSGWALDVAEKQLERALGAIGFEFGDIQRFLVTHIHRDHYTLAIQLRRVYGTKVALGIGEQPSLERAMTRRPPDGQARQMVRWGAEPLVKQWIESVGERGVIDHYEEPDEWLDGITTIEFGDRTLTVLPTPGHTQGHVVFVDEQARTLFAGDHVLPHITPSIGFQPEPAKLPLADYLESLRLVRSYPDLRLLPAHGPVAPSTHARVDELLAHHEERLAETLAAVRDGAGTAFEAAGRLGWTRRRRRYDELDLFNQTLAAGETAAHLDVLVLRGELSSTMVDGVAEYAVTPPSAP
ncbi:MBL fold metallo-hydrolase [Actinophytocola oryzae]|uniref:Glyoxylase-like metal-dependent hydrolase (Beta-lactamase superfamily II) n=1 Tax=Actinophytocola oryzae TaxID=502181 RepID=A0A4R7VST5_9PSEU|nr:MBL fold metallo-hydrolase [Actinophytocola oryzae]TDV52277.1 glyoxylase-like metal-dependent hydrolase (beta-lactamase superfamily II) [Actinophytocola oryzae]